MTTTAKRTDVHSAVNLRTEDYKYMGSLDWKAGASGEPGSVPARVALINAVIVTPGRKWAGIHGSGQCDHCGATNLRYAALLLHIPTNTVLEVGETCLENRFERATADFQMLRKQAELDRAAQRIKKARAAFVEANPDLAFLDSGEFPVSLARNNFVASVSDQLRRNGMLSDAQIAGIRKAVLAAAIRAAEKAQEVELPKVDAVLGEHVLLTGEIVWMGWKDGMFPGMKMTLRDDRGFTVYGTVSSKIANARKGLRVQFMATVSRSNESTHGYFSRPAKVKVLG